jgi:hypothetical protein
VIWYRHWLEMRATVLASVGTAIIGSLYFVRDLVAESGYGDLVSPIRKGDTTPPFGPLLGLMDSLNASQINLISSHAMFSWFVVLLLSYALSGDGLKVISRWTGTGLLSATQFTLSLPVSRRHVVVTRIVASYIVGALTLFAIAATNAAAFSFTPHAVPLRQLLLVSAFGTLLVLFWSSFLVLLTVIVGQGWAFAVTFIPAMILGSIPGIYGMTASASRQLDPALILLFIVILGFVLAGTVAAATSEEV